jgi:peptide/nickel transport system permease protein
VRGYLLRRLGQSVAVVLLVATATFVLIHLAPGDPFESALANPKLGEAVRDKWRAIYGFDRPLHEQYLRYMGAVVRGDLGFSFSTNRPVLEALGAALPNTLFLMTLALAGSFAIGIALGVAQAVRRGKFADRVLGTIALVFYSLPDFWLAVMVLLTFAYWIPVLPAGGAVDAVMYPYLSFGERIVDRIEHVILPALTLTALTSAAIARHQRSAMLDVLGDEFVRTARAKGASERRVIMRHALRNALLPVITLFGLYFPALLGGAVLVERIFSWPGMGQLTLDALSLRDYPLVVASAIVASVMVVTGGLIADVLAAVVDPRMRRS